MGRAKLMRNIGLVTLVTLLLSGGWLAGCHGGTGSPYRLAVVVVVDQMRPDYLTRFGSEFHGGLRRLLDRGADFTEAYDDYAATETAVGHATIATGMLPTHHGIVANNWYDQRQGKYVYACEDTSAHILNHPDLPGRSPVLLTMPTVGDWLKKRSPHSKVVSASLKDRAAINMGGHYPDAAYWYSHNDGQFVTSTFYADTLPAWVDTFNTSGAANAYLTDGWVGTEPEGSFSHPFDTTGRGMRGYYRDLYGTPFADRLLLEFSKTLLDRTQVGKDDIPDILWISCSSGDVIGHAYGPDSPEIHDYYLRLDRELQTLFDHLDANIGRDRYFVILTSDHGVMPTPEALRKKGVADARRISPELVDSAVESTLAYVAHDFNASPAWLKPGSEGVTIDTAAVLKVGIDVQALEEAAADALRKLPFLEDVYTDAELGDPNTPQRPYLRLFQNSWFPGRGDQLKFRFPENCLITDSPTGTTHGSPYRYDTHVPIIVSGDGIEGGVRSDSVTTVDIAPTVFELLGYKTPDDVDGHSLLERH